MNWYRLAFIFLPAAIRGDIMYLSFFLPFLFGPILQRVVRTFVTLYDKTDNIKVFAHRPRSCLSCCWRSAAANPGAAPVVKRARLRCPCLSTYDSRLTHVCLAQCVVKVPRAEYVSFAWSAIGNTCLVWAFLGAHLVATGVARMLAA